MGNSKRVKYLSSTRGVREADSKSLGKEQRGSAQDRLGEGLLCANDITRGQYDAWY